MKALIFLGILLTQFSCCMFSKTMYAESLKEIDTTSVRICCIDSVQQNSKIYIIQYRDKR